MTDAETYGYKPYPSYKISGASWLGEIPEHWEARQIRTVARVMNGATPSTSVPEYWDGDVVWITPDDLGKSRGRFITGSERRITQAGYEACGTNLAPPGSIVLSTRAPIGHIGVLRSPACTNQGCRLLSVKGNFQSTFAFYQLTAARPELESLGQGTTFTELSKGTLAAFPVALPPVDEQATIVRYLDDADQRIRAYVSAKERLIALLEEERQAVIHQAVTRGLDPNVKLKPSGVEWLGDMPEHWEIRRGKRLFSPRQELAKPNDIQLSATQAYGVIPQDEYEQRVGRRVVKISLHLEKRHHVEVDDFVISMRSFEGGLERAWATGCIRSSYVVLRPAIEVDVEFFSYLFKSQAYIQALQSTANFIRDGQDLNFNNFCAVDLPFPPTEEQRRMAVALVEATANTDTTIARARRQIKLIEEYRTRLIADVVTGKLDVREAKP